MLKLICSDDSITLETTDQAFDTWIANRVQLAVGAGQPLYIEPGYASFLVPDTLPQLQDLPDSLDWFEGEDEDMIEIGLKGVWLRSDPAEEEGVLIAPISQALAEQLVTLWVEAQRYTAA